MRPRFTRKNCIGEKETISESFDQLVYRPPWFPLDKIKTIVDVGAFIGSFTLWAKEQWPNAIIHSYEPDPESFEILSKNVKLVNSDKKISLYNLGVWGTEKNHKLKRFRKTPGNNTLVYDERPFTEDIAEKLVIKTRKIKYVINEIGGKIDLLKLDCEGSEYDILYSLSKLDLKKIRFIVLEYHEFDKGGKRTSKSLSDYLRSNGFVTQIIPISIREKMGLGYIYASSEIKKDKILLNAFDDQTSRLTQLTKVLDGREDYAFDLQKTIGKKNIDLKALNKLVKEKDVDLKALNKLVKEKDVDLKALNKLVKEKDVDLKALNKLVKEKDVDLKALNKLVKEKDVDLKALNKLVKEKDVDLKALNKLVKEKDVDLEDLNKLVKEKDVDLEDLNKLVKEKDVDLEDLNKLVKEKDVDLKALNKLVKEKDVDLEDLNKLVKEKDVDLKALNKLVKEKDVDLEDLNKLVKEKDVDLEDLNKLVKEKDVDLEDLNKLVKEKDVDLEDLNKLVKEKDVDLEDSSQLIKNRENELIHLRSELHEIKSSQIFNLMKRVSNKVDNLFPNETKRGEFKNIVKSSVEIIQKDGVKNYSKAVQEKVKRKEFSVHSQNSLSEKEEKDLRKKIAKNKPLQISAVSEPAFKADFDFQILFDEPIKEEKSQINTEEITICTIASSNYLAHVKVLTDSFLKYNKNGQVFVLLVDTIQNDFEPTKEKFKLITLKELEIPNLESFCFKYNIVELNTAVKARFLECLLTRFNLRKLIYFDPDILITNNLSNLWKLLEKNSIIITPHITSSIDDGKKPSEHDIIKAGNYNLGFLAISNTKTTQSFLQWWKAKLYDFCLMEPDKGYHVDQKWIDLVPSMFDGVYVLRHPGFNVAYWNLSERKIEIKNENIFVNSKPLYFFHFSGFSPENIESISKHQNRHDLKNLKHLKPLFEHYRNLLIKNEYLKFKKSKYRYDYFSNGIKIPDIARRIYYDSIDKLDFKNPFDVSGKSFLGYLNSTVDNKYPIVTRLWYKIYESREDLKEKYREPLDKDRVSFLQWINGSLTNEHDLDFIFLNPLERMYLENKNSDLHIKDMNIENKKILENFSNKKKIGINVSGYFQGEFGVGEEARNFVKALKSVGISHALNNITADNHRWQDETFLNFQNENPYPINLVIVNADQAEIIYKQFSSEYFRNKFNVGAWAWELPSFPESMSKSYEHFNEIWTLSNFMANAISKAIPIPVVKLTYPLELDESKLIKNRSKFSLEEDHFVFLFIFDFYSIFERKNPLGAIQAFKNAFSEKEKVTFLIKTINGSFFSSENKKFRKACNQSNIKVIDEHLSKDEILSLIASSDCYVSLHRSEGVGLTIAEAMYAGKPVIATAYGGNNDFMTVNNSYPVKFKMVKIKEDFGPYKKGNVWAEPDIKNATELMQYVFENRDKANEIGKTASNDIKELMNPKVTGEQILDRINAITKTLKT